MAELLGCWANNPATLQQPPVTPDHSSPAAQQGGCWAAGGLLAAAGLLGCWVVVLLGCWFRATFVWLIVLLELELRQGVGISVVDGHNHSLKAM